MKSSWRHLSLLLLFLVYSLILGRTDHPHLCLVQVRDARTGARIDGARLNVRSQSLDPKAPDVVLEETEAGIRIKVPAGHWQVQVTAPGYQALGFEMQAEPGMPGRFRVFLEPEPVARFRHGPSRVIPSDTAVTLVGWVNDSLTGKPLADVQVWATNLPWRTRTSTEGFFRLRLTSGPTVQNSALELRFRKAGYRPVAVTLSPVGRGQTAFLHIDLAPAKPTGRAPGGFQAPGKLESFETPLQNATLPATPPVLPQTIRVGRQCTGTQCAAVDVMHLETYCKLVLPAEWFPCWGSLFKGENSLMAGAVAIRTVAVWYVYHPIDANYDICDNSTCQVLGNVRTTLTDAAVDSTRSWLVIDDQSRLFKSEYAAENNNQGCGNGYAGTGSTSVCIYDPVCLNQTPSGHGRGMCQWGTVRWATGTVVQTSQPCASGPPHAFGQRNWQDILTHYYPGSQVVPGITAEVTALAVLPDTVSPGGSFRIQYRIQSSHTVGLLGGASVAPTGSGAWVSDPPHDTLWVLQGGEQWRERRFSLPTGAAPGSYDVWGALWVDVDGNGRINSADRRVASLIGNGLFFVGQPTGLALPLSNRSEIKVFQEVFPNPFNGRAHVRLVLPMSLRVSMALYDVAGRRVRQVFRGILSAGEHRLALDASSLPSGIYVYLINLSRSGQPVRRFAGKLVLIR